MRKNTHGPGPPTVAPAEARAIATEAYVYGFPRVDHYRIWYYVDRSNPEFKAPLNQIRNVPRVFTPADKIIQTPNSDTPDPFAMLDLWSAVRQPRRSSPRQPAKLRIEVNA